MTKKEINDQLNRREWLVRLTQFVAAVFGLSIKSQWQPASQETPIDGAVGLWWSADDPTAECVYRDGEPVEFLRGSIVGVRYFDYTLPPSEVSHVSWMMSRDAESAPIFLESREGNGIRFIESEMTVIETPKLKAEVP